MPAPRGTGDRIHLEPTTYAPMHGFHLPAQPWKERALCTQTDPEAFFPDKGGSTREAKRICGDCDVSAECLQTALDNDERFGIWGGLSERERRKLAKTTSQNGSAQ